MLLLCRVLLPRQLWVCPGKFVWRGVGSTPQEALHTVNCRFIKSVPTCHITYRSREPTLFMKVRTHTNIAHYAMSTHSLSVSDSVSVHVRYGLQGVVTLVIMPLPSPNKHTPTALCALCGARCEVRVPLRCFCTGGVSSVFLVRGRVLHAVLEWGVMGEGG